MTSQASGPLSGIKVLEIAGTGPGPFCVMVLSDFGADVIRVDRADAVGGPGDTLASVDVLARGRRSIAVDLKQPGGVDLVLRLADRSDVLIEGYRPGVMERLGLGSRLSVRGRLRRLGRPEPTGRLTGIASTAGTARK